jgi:hypothetical protein
MNPFLLLGLGLATPLLILVLVLLPLYMGIFCSTYLMYVDQRSMLLEHAGQAFYVVGVYKHMVQHWWQNIASVDHLNYTLPLLLPPLIGALVACYAAAHAIRKISQYFRLA